MTRGGLCAVLLAWSVSSSPAAPPNLKLPDVIQAKEQYVRFTPDTNATSVVYIGLSGVEAFPTDELKDPRRFLLDTRGLAEGTYGFAAVAANKDGEQVRANFVVVVGKPGPGPVIPPTDPLTKAVQAAYDKDPSPTKAADVKALAGVFRDVVAKVAAAPELFTTGEFATFVQTSRQKLIGERLETVRALLGVELESLKLPEAANVVLTAEQRVAVQKLFTRLTTVLEAVK